MEYFSRKAYEASQTPKGKKQWQQLEKQYAAHLRSINPQLTGGWRQVASEDFSGQTVRVVERPAFDQVILELSEHVFIFRGVNQARLEEGNQPEITWVCHEVHVIEDGTLELQVLMSEGELRVIAEEVRVYRSDSSAQSRAAA